MIQLSWRHSRAVLFEVNKSVWLPFPPGLWTPFCFLRWNRWIPLVSPHFRSFHEHGSPNWANLPTFTGKVDWHGGRRCCRVGWGQVAIASFLKLCGKFCLFTILSLKKVIMINLFHWPFVNFCLDYAKILSPPGFRGFDSSSQRLQALELSLLLLGLPCKTECPNGLPQLWEGDAGLLGHNRFRDLFPTTKDERYVTTRECRFHFGQFTSLEGIGWDFLLLTSLSLKCF